MRVVGGLGKANAFVVHTNGTTYGLLYPLVLARNRTLTVELNALPDATAASFDAMFPGGAGVWSAAAVKAQEVGGGTVPGKRRWRVSVSFTGDERAHHAAILRQS